MQTVTKCVWSPRDNGETPLELEQYFQTADEIHISTTVFYYSLPDDSTLAGSIEQSIALGGAIGVYRPLRGEELGITVQIKEYTYNEIIAMATQACAQNKKVTLFFNRKLNDEAEKYFYTITVKEVPDYSAIITHLHSLNIIQVDDSHTSQMMVTDPRVFCFEEVMTDENRIEVDILGTTYGKEQTDRIMNLYYGTLT